MYVFKIARYSSGVAKCPFMEREVPPSERRTSEYQWPSMFACPQTTSNIQQTYSTDNQAAAIAIYAAQNGMRIVKTYEDSGKSGLNFKGRSGLQALLRDVRQPSPGFEAVLVYDVSRWGRFPDPDEAATYAYTCKRHGIEVIYCAELKGIVLNTIFMQVQAIIAARSRHLDDGQMLEILRQTLKLVRLDHRARHPAQLVYQRASATPADRTVCSAL